MVSISHLLERFSNSSKASLARTADWVNSQAVFGNFSERSGSSCNDDDDDARHNQTSRVQQTGKSAGSNLRIDHLLNSTYRSTNVTPVVGANEEEEGMCFLMGCQICETQTPAEQILARNQNLCGLHIVLRSAEDGGDEAWSSVVSDDTGDRRRGFLKRKAKRVARFCGHLYESVVRRWS